MGGILGCKGAEKPCRVDGASFAPLSPALFLSLETFPRTRLFCFEGNLLVLPVGESGNKLMIM